MFKIVDQDNNTDIQKGTVIKKIIKEKVEDTNPNLYVKRSEVALKESRYYDALIEIRKAVEYSGNKEEYAKQEQSVVNALKGLGGNQIYNIAKRFEQNNDISEAIIWYKRAGANKNALYKLGCLYYNSQKSDFENSEAMRYLKKSFKMGNANAGLKVVNHYKNKGTLEGLLTAKKYMQGLKETGIYRANDIDNEINEKLGQYNLLSKVLVRAKMNKFKIIFIALFIIISTIFIYDYSAYSTFKKMPKITSSKFYFNGNSIWYDEGLFIGNEYVISEELEYTPRYAPEPNIVYKVVDESIVKLDNGKLIPLTEGETTLEVIYCDKVIKRLILKSIKAEDYIEIINSVSSIKKVGHEETLSFKLSNNYSEKIDDELLTVTSSNEDVIKIDELSDKYTYNVNAVGEGNATVTIKYKNTIKEIDFEISGVAYSILHKLTAIKNSGISFDDNDSSTFKILKGEEVQLSYEIIDNETGNSISKKATNIYTENTDIISVLKDSSNYYNDSNYKVLGLSEGKATVIIEYNNIKEYVEIEVVGEKDTIRLGVSEYSLFVGEDINVKYELKSNYETPRDDYLSISVDDSSIISATLNTYNKWITIRALDLGNTTVRVKYRNNAEEVINITVKERPTVVETRRKFRFDVGLMQVDNQYYQYMSTHNCISYDYDIEKTMSDGTIIKADSGKDYDFQYGFSYKVYVGINNNGEFYAMKNSDRLYASDYEEYLKLYPDTPIKEYYKANLMIKVVIKANGEQFERYVPVYYSNGYKGNIEIELIEY